MISQYLSRLRAIGEKATKGQWDYVKVQDDSHPSFVHCGVDRIADNTTIHDANFMVTAHDNWDRLIKINEVLVEALEFYADNRSWDDRWIDEGDDGGDIYDVIVRHDVEVVSGNGKDEPSKYLTHGGIKARAALAQCEEMVKGEV